MNKHQLDFDIVICGGGMVGATLTALLATDRHLKSLRIALIEAQILSPPTDEVDVRVSAISRASERILSHCGAWSLIQPSRRCAYQDMMVWDGESIAPDLNNTQLALHFSAASMAEPNLGYIIANNCVQWAALERCNQLGVTRFATALSSVKFEETHALIQLNDGRSITASLVVGADGTKSVSRDCADIKAHVKSYEQSALVIHVRTEHPHQHTAWQRFLSAGPIAFLPLNDGRSSIVWTTTPDHAAQLLKLDDVALAIAIGHASDYVLGDIEIAGVRAAFPLQFAHVDEYCRPRFVLVGDAAHSIHPLAGQGVNLGMMDAASLVQVLSDAHQAGASADALSELHVLRRFERWRKSENTVALGMVDTLNRLFSNDNMTVGMVRRTGLRAVENVPMLKRFFTHHAFVIAGDAPRMVKEV